MDGSQITAKDIGNDFYINVYIKDCPLELRRKWIEYMRPNVLTKSYKEDLDIIIDSKNINKESEKAFSNLVKVNRTNLSDADNRFLTKSINGYLKLRFQNLDKEKVMKFDEYSSNYFAQKFLPVLNNNLLNIWGNLTLEEKKKKILEEINKFNSSLI